jgi:hypothetical protein
VNCCFKRRHRDGSTVEFNPNGWITDDPIKADHCPHRHISLGVFNQPLAKVNQCRRVKSRLRVASSSTPASNANEIVRCQYRDTPSAADDSRSALGRINL